MWSKSGKIWFFQKGEAKVEIIILPLVVIQSSPLLATPEYSEKNRCSGYNNFNECHLFSSEYSDAGLKTTGLRMIILT